VAPHAGLPMQRPGPVARIQWLSMAQLEEVLQEAVRFAKDWAELRAVTRARLYNRVVSASLEVCVLGGLVWGQTKCDVGWSVSGLDWF
jgi:hypothetical protein